MKYTLFIWLFVLGITMVNSQTIEGDWKTYDDKTNKQKSIISIYKKGDKYFAKITDLLMTAKDKLCEKCEGDKKNKPLIGMEILEGLKKDEDEFNGGTILDPESGDIYKCYVKLVKKDKLKVRGFIGFSVLGRTQYWIRK